MLSPYNMTRRYRGGNALNFITATELRPRATEIVREIEETGEGNQPEIKKIANP